MNAPIGSSALKSERLLEILNEVCRRAGLDPRGARLIKFTNNAVFRLATSPVVVRIAGSRAVRDRVPKVIAVAQWLAMHDAPAVRLLPGVAQPVAVAGHLATLWRCVPEGGPAPTGADLAHILHRFHSLPEVPALPAWRPVEPIRQRLSEADVLTSEEYDYLWTTCDEVEQTLGRVDFELPQGPIHGDSFLGNLIATADGPVICDFDSAALGPREWDLTPVAVGSLRFTYGTEANRQLADAYGFDVAKWHGFPVLRKLRELQLVTSVLPTLGGNPSLRPQWRHRFTTFRHGDTDARWTPYQ